MSRFVIALPLTALLLFGCNETPASCTSSRDCAGLLCDRSRNECVECLTDVDCLNADEACIARSCVVQTPCSTSRECPGQVCDTRAGYCVECVVNGDCPVGQQCDSRVCIDPPTSCDSDRACSDEGLVCALDRGVCVECVRNADCPGGECRGNHCAPVVVGTDAGPVVDHDAGPVTGFDAGPVVGFDAGPVIGHDAGPVVGHDAGPVVGFDAGRDAGPVVGHDAGPVVGHDAGPSTHCLPTPGSLVITEVMIASNAGSDNGEWFEIYNTTGCTIDLGGMVIDSPTGAGSPVTHTITAGLIAAHDYFVFAKHPDPLANHGLPYDYAFGPAPSGFTTIALSNDDDVLAISYLGTTIDHVQWSDGTLVVGSSQQLSPAAFTLDNLDVYGSFYCEGTLLYGFTTGAVPVYGSPGSANRTCP